MNETSYSSEQLDRVVILESSKQLDDSINTEQFNSTPDGVVMLESIRESSLTTAD